MPGHFKRADGDSEYSHDDFNAILEAVEMLLRIRVDAPLSLDKLTSGWVLGLINPKEQVHVKITSIPNITDDVDTGHKDGETIVMVKWYDVENDELTGPEIAVVAVHADPEVGDQFDMYKPWGGTGHVIDEEGEKVRWREIAGGGGDLPTGQYQFMMYQMVTTNESGWDFTMSHPILEVDPGP